jgi:hypothetical protein
MRSKRILTGVAFVAAITVAGCSRDQARSSSASAEIATADMPVAYLKVPPRPMARLAFHAPQGTSLAYEHTIDIRMPAKAIPDRVAAVQAACFSQSVGDCAVLDVRQEGGDFPSASISVRVAPDGVDKLIGNAAQGGDITARSTHAEDLADAVKNAQLIRTRLEKEHARLVEFQDKPDVKLGDMLKLSERLAEVEASLDMATQEQAQHRRRIDTNQLTMRFMPTGVEAGGSEVGNAFRDSGKIIASMTARVIRVAAGAIPILIVAWVLWVFVRRVFRRRVKVRAAA